MPEEPDSVPPRAGARSALRERATDRQRRWRARTGRVGSTRVALADLGRVLERGSPAVVAELVALVGEDVAADAREAWTAAGGEVPEQRGSVTG